ncbi:hypothetical protein [Halostella salina]|uniref:hypothetical protein n=1 Tax=Halostella salina TaxID=1547897 RepID=UPI000EF84AB0|nr:hypothetical protein [Halostella salina]
MAANQPPPPERHRDSTSPAGSVAGRARTAQLRARIAALEQALDQERKRRQAVIARYERLLDERARTANDDRSDRDAGLLDRLRR